jgi:diaminopimelate epimerase
MNFIKKLSPSAIQLRIFERGVESETHTCGTVSIASALIASKEWKLQSPITVIPTTEIPLSIHFEIINSNIRNVN